ncbi:hypothetical protein AALP_AA5G127300 [Arabis alpina]|uniref:Uncharacterized protein n=1 Tax=Arabis alpina TaxID=50452 RepID=A0A087GWP9_ARAAL|nr:hypothetical protein AALP_AA5G127300 [Arabis alpina]
MFIVSFDMIHEIDTQVMRRVDISSPSLKKKGGGEKMT